MKIALLLIISAISSSVFAQGIKPSQEELASAWHAEQAQIKANYDKKSPAEKARIDKINAYWDAKSFYENTHTHH
jgi:hypothetical protein